MRLKTNNVEVTIVGTDNNVLAVLWVVGVHVDSAVVRVTQEIAGGKMRTIVYPLHNVQSVTWTRGE